MTDSLISDLQKLFKFLKKPRKKSGKMYKAKSWLDVQFHK